MFEDKRSSIASQVKLKHLQHLLHATITHSDHPPGVAHEHGHAHRASEYLFLCCDIHTHACAHSHATDCVRVERNNVKREQIP